MAEADAEDLTGKAVIELARVALTQEHRAGVSEMLRSIAGGVEAAGCILWMGTPSSNLNADPPHGELFVLAEWFAGIEFGPLPNLPLISATGQAILNDRPVQLVDEEGFGLQGTDALLPGAGTRCVLSTPLTFSSGKRGALSAYRKVANPFSPQEIRRLEELAHLLPSLYDAISDKVSYRMVREVMRILEQADGESQEGIEDFRGTAKALCDKVASTFESLETSLFLQDSLDKPGLFRLVASTWPYMRQLTVRSYKGSKEEGLTGWVLEKGRSVKVFDLGHLDKEKMFLQVAYPELVWQDSMRIEQSVRQFLKVPPWQNLQPLSFMAAPVLAGRRVLGVIRCCIAKRGPYYFADRDLGLLELIADQIGQAWLGRLRRREIEEENRTWQRLVESLGDLNRFVEQQVAAGKTDEVQIFHKALEATHSVIQGAKISDVRLLDKEKRELFFGATFGEAWEQGSPTEIRKRYHRRFPIDDAAPHSGGAHVMRTGHVYLIPDTKDPRYHYSESFGATRRMIIAPIGVGEDIFGVLDIRSSGDRPFPAHAARVAELLGQQLAVYHYMIVAIKELRRLPEMQAQTFEDFTHQLKSPILQVHARIQNAVRLLSQPNVSFPPQLERHMLAIRGLAAKAKQVGQGLGLFAALARGREPQPKLERLFDDTLTKTLIEAATDQENILDPQREIRFHVERDGFKILRSNKVEADANLLLQAVNNLLDNAVKYSYSGSAIRIYGGLTATGRFHISVGNRGLPITPEEISRCTIRGWRSARAQEVTGEGSGIGLWIIDHIMRAHGGELLIIPTNRDQWTEVRLVFPAVAL